MDVNPLQKRAEPSERSQGVGKVRRLNSHFNLACKSHTDQRSQNGVIQLIGKVFRSEERRSVEDVVFSGQTRLDAKRAMLRYWSQNEDNLGLEFTEFQRRCRLLEDDRTIVFKAS